MKTFDQSNRPPLRAEYHSLFREGFRCLFLLYSSAAGRTETKRPRDVSPQPPRWLLNC